MLAKKLKKQSNISADIIGNFDAFKLQMKEAIVFASHNDDVIVVVIQDKNNPNQQLQITLNKLQ